MTFTKKSKELIEFFEGRKHTAYSDSAGISTIGVGHTKGVKADMKATDTQIDKWLDEDLTDALNRVNKTVYKDMTQGELDALVSQAFNLRSFEKLGFYFNLDKEVWRKKTLLYCRDVKGNWLKGLKIRRISERLLSEDREWKEFAIWGQKKTTTIDLILKKEKELFP
ncbi:MAG: lysozyme [Candidatus Pacearchaeota archaeon]